MSEKTNNATAAADRNDPNEISLVERLQKIEKLAKEKSAQAEKTGQGQQSQNEDLYSTNNKRSYAKPGKLLPEQIVKKYLQVDNSFYFKDKTIAFEDLGKTIKIGTENLTVIRDALAIAKTRDWETIKVKGTDEFKQKVWLEASILGMEVKGYTPSKVDVAELKQAQEKINEGKGKGQEGNIISNDKSQAAYLKVGQTIEGKLIAHGKEPYKNDPDKEKSYYIKLEVDGQQKTYWGKDLELAIKENRQNPQIGDVVSLGKTGKKDVSLKEEVLDKDGKVAVEETKTVNKNQWTLKVIEPIKQQGIDERTKAMRDGKDIERRVANDLPNLAEVIAVARLGEKIAEQALVTGALRSEDEKIAMVNYIKAGLRDAVKQGKNIKNPELIQEVGQKAAVVANNITNDNLQAIKNKVPQQERAIVR